VNKIGAVFFVDSQAAVLAVCSPIPSDCSVINRTEEISQLIRKCWEIVLWTPSHCGTPGNDKIDTLAKDESNLLSPEEPNTYQQAVASSIWRTQTSQRQSLRDGSGDKLPSAPRRSFSVANFRLITGHDYLQRHPNRIGLKDSRRAQRAATPTKWSLITSKDTEVCKKPCTTSIAGMDGGNCQYYTGLQEGKSVTFFTEAFPLC
jgi:hypothetical protein